MYRMGVYFECKMLNRKELILEIFVNSLRSLNVKEYQTAICMYVHICILLNHNNIIINLDLVYMISCTCAVL